MIQKNIHRQLKKLLKFLLFKNIKSRNKNSKFFPYKFNVVFNLIFKIYKNIHVNNLIFLFLRVYNYLYTIIYNRFYFCLKRIIFLINNKIIIIDKHYKFLERLFCKYKHLKSKNKMQYFIN